MRTIELRFHMHCCHCDEEMHLGMDKTIGADDDHIHWLVRPCECLSIKRIAELERKLRMANTVNRDMDESCTKRIAELVEENERLKKLAEELSSGSFAVIQRSIKDRERAEAALREVGLDFQNVLDEVEITVWDTRNGEPPPDVQYLCDRIRAILDKHFQSADAKSSD